MASQSLTNNLTNKKIYYEEKAFTNGKLQS